MRGLTLNLLINYLLTIQFKMFHYFNTYTPLIYSVRKVTRLRTLFAFQVLQFSAQPHVCYFCC